MTRKLSPAARAAYDQADPVHRSRDDALVSEARTLTKLQAKRRALRSTLRDIDKQIKVTRRNLRALMADKAPAWNEQAPPLRAFGETES